MAVVNKELYALVVALGKLKRQLGVKKTQSREWEVGCIDNWLVNCYNKLVRTIV